MYVLAILFLSIGIVLVGILVFKLHPFLALLLAGMTVALLTPADVLRQYAAGQVSSGKWTQQVAREFVESTAAERIADAFGQTCASIGILIAMAAIIGKCLLDSGAADRIVRSTVSLVGQRRAPLAFVASSFLLGIPVFFDTVFYLMIPLGKALRMRTGRNYVLYILSIVAGGSMAHSLVPPTPGPLYVADRMGVDLLTMIVAGCVVGVISASAAFAFACWLDRRIDVPLRGSTELSLETLRSLAERDDRELPGLLAALTPIVLPVFLIALQTGVDAWNESLPPDVEMPAWYPHFRWVVDTVGNKNVALMLAAASALAMLAWNRRQDPGRIGEGLGKALESGGLIILITAAGGAFGAAVRQSGIADVIARSTSDVPPLLILPIAFGITMLIRTAQGSATVAMITSVGILQQFAANGTLPYHDVYLALAIGCGSKPVAWMADSGFWVICRMSGMTEAEGLKTVSPTSVVMGVAGLAATMAGAILFPLV